MLLVSELQYGYKNKAINQPLQFSLRGGQMLLVAGRNGIGKSTLLRTLAGLQLPVGGSVSIDELNIHRQPPEIVAGKVSVMFSMPPDLPQTQCLDVVMTGMQRNFGLFQTNLSAEKKTAMDCLEKTGMGHFSQRDFNTLSDGEKQKVMLARSLAQDTPLLILDEPLAFLDYPGRRQMLELLQKICRDENKAIIYSSHDLDISLQYCEQLLLLKKENWQLQTDAASINSLRAAELFTAE